MERARPPRSGIPTLLGSNSGRVHSQGKEKGDAVTYNTVGRINSGSCQISNRKEKSSNSSRQPSPRLHRSGHRLITVSGDSTENLDTKLQYNTAHPVQHQTTRQRPPTVRLCTTNSNPERSDVYNHLEREPADQTTVGLTVAHNSLSNSQQKISRNTLADRDICDSRSSEQRGTHRKESHYTETGIQRDHRGQSLEYTHFTSDVISDIPLPGSECSEQRNEWASNLSQSELDDNPLINNSLPRDALTRHMNENLIVAVGGDGNASKTLNPDGETYTDTTSAEIDYPIRGTISPLTSKIAIKRSVGSVDEVSFVFGRPVSPTNDQISCRTHQSIPNTEMARCMSPFRYTPRHCSRREMSPSSDVLPVRRGIALGAYSKRRVLSPPSVLGLSSATDPGGHHQGRIYCEHCSGCLVELKRQALKLMFPDSGSGCYLAQMLSENTVGPTSGMFYAQTFTEYTTNLLDGYLQANEQGVDQKKQKNNT